jgi:hypothetical protein
VALDSDYPGIRKYFTRSGAKVLGISTANAKKIEI